LGQVERYLKQAIVDKDPNVASAAIVSGTHLIRTSPDIVCFFISFFWKEEFDLL
jgi:coatomer protein complex subunit gamma